MKNVKTICVGISAFNEEENIFFILKDLISQKGDNFIVKKIIVLDDASTDRTIEEIKLLNSKKIFIINNKTRVGKSKNLNCLLKHMNCDINIFLDADIRLKEKFFLFKLVREFKLNNSDLVAPHVTPINKTALFERIIYQGHMFKEYIKRHWNNGDNYLAFSGALLALSKKFTRQIIIPEGIKNDDAYIYFTAKKLGFKTSYTYFLSVYFYSPQNFIDHMNQSSRFKTSYNELQKYFGQKLKEKYQIPKLILLKSATLSIINNSFLFFSYISIVLITYLFQDKKVSHLWNTAISTKGKLKL